MTTRPMAAGLASVAKRTVALTPVRPTRGGWTRARTRSLLALVAVLLLLFLLRPHLVGGHGRSPGMNVAYAALTLLWIAATVPGGLADRSRAMRLAAARRAHPGEPWLGDHDWDSSGVALSPVGRLRSRSSRPAGRALLLSPGVLWMFLLAPFFFFSLFYRGPYRFSSSPAGSPGDAVALWLAFAFGAGVLPLLWRLWRLHGDGTSHVTFTRFPFAPGERMTLHFGTSAGGASFTQVVFFLRHVREVSGGPFGWHHGALTTFEIEDRRPPGALPGPEQQVVLEFDVPADAEGTRLSAALPSYWVLDVIGCTSSGEYHESFLVPVYARPTAESA